MISKAHLLKVIDPCYFCGKEITELFGRNSSSFVTHHIDNNSENNKKENLVPVHYGCHTIHHRKQWTCSEETILKMSLIKRGKKHSEETRRKMSEAHKGKPHPMSEETRLKISKAAKGRVITQEWRNKISESMKGNIPWNKGLSEPYSEGTIKRMSEAARRYHQRHKSLLL